MKVWELQQSFGLDSLILTERPEPQPGPGQVLVKMRAWSINYRDLMMVNGTYNPKLRFPLVPLSDGVGEIVALGPGVSRVKPGQRVAGIFMQSWLEGGLTEEHAKSALGGAREGVAAEQVVFDAEGVVGVPEHLSDAEAATLPCAGVTAWHALVSSGNLERGETILTQGTGGVSIFAIQFAQALGARVIATSSSDAKLARVLKLGASDGINYRATPGWGQRARELAGGIGVDQIVEVGGAGTLAESLRAVRTGGRISLIGVLSGAGQINPMPILMKNVCVQGIFVGSRAMFEAMNKAIAHFHLQPVVDRMFSFAELPEALRHMEHAAHFGKIVLG